MVAVFADFGWKFSQKALVYADASAALGIVQRRGAGSIRHIDTRLLWVQEQTAKEKIQYLKLAGTVNPSDMGTKHLDAETIKRHMASWNLEVRQGRPGIAPGVTPWGPQPEKEELTAIGALTLTIGSPQLWVGGGRHWFKKSAYQNKVVGVLEGVVARERWYVP